MGPITEAEKRENGEVEQVSLGCERIKSRNEGAGETLLSQCIWALSQGGGTSLCIQWRRDKESRQADHRLPGGCE